MEAGHCGQNTYSGRGVRAWLCYDRRLDDEKVKMFLA